MTTSHHNYLPKQYQVNNQLPINHNYLPQQFSNSKVIFDEIKELVKRGDFTLGQAVDELEDGFKKITQTKYAIGVGSGTDAIFLSLKAAGIDSTDNITKEQFTSRVPFTTKSEIVTDHANNNPFGSNFDTNFVYGPIFGSMYYAGLRFRIK